MPNRRMQTDRVNRRGFIFKAGMTAAEFLIGASVFQFARKAAAQESTLQRTPPKMAIIIDDIGISRARADMFLELDLPLTFAVLPRLAFSRQLAHEIYSQGREVLLHQPMEPCNHCMDPGPGALFKGATKTDIRRTILENLEEVPFAVGVNNHMGSLFTECPDEMHVTLDEIKRNRRFFVDSLTSTHSIGWQTARTMRLPASRRNIFLDTRVDQEVILDQLYRLKHIAEKYGRAVGIGHPYRETANALQLFFGREQVALLPVSQLIYS
jgi:uncharacterized protein